MSIYQRIKDLANEKNISIRELEKQLDFSNGAVNKWRKKAPSDKLEKVANYFDVTTDYLLGRTGIKEKRPRRVRNLKEIVPVEEYEDEHAYYNERAILIHTFDTLLNLLILNGFDLGCISDNFDENYDYYQNFIINYAGISNEKFARTFIDLINETVIVINKNKDDSDEILKDIINFTKFMNSKYHKYTPMDASDFDIWFSYIFVRN